MTGITSITPSGATIGGTITINGSDFGATQGTNNYIEISGINVTASSWSDTQIVATVPVGATSGLVYVHIPGFVFESAFGFIPPPSGNVAPATNVQGYLAFQWNRRNGDIFGGPGAVRGDDANGGVDVSTGERRSHGPPVDPARHL